MKPLVILLLAFLASLYSNAQDEWQAVGPDESHQLDYDRAVWADFHFSPLNQPYVVLRTDDNRPTIVKKYDGNSWTKVGNGISVDIANSGPYSNILFPVIAVDSANHIFVAQTEADTIFQQNVYSFNGANWINLQAPALQNVGVYSSIVAGGSDKLYVANFTKFLATPSKIHVLKYNGSSWVNISDSSFKIKSITEIKLTLDESGMLFLSCQSDSNSILLKYDQSKWDTICQFPRSVLLHPYNDTVYAAYPSFYPRIWKLHGNTWTLTDTSLFNDDYESPTSLQLVSNSKGELFFGCIAYSKKSMFRHQVKLARFKNGKWDSYDDVGCKFRNPSLTRLDVIKMRTNHNGIPHVLCPPGNYPVKEHVLKKYTFPGWEYVGKVGIYQDTLLLDEVSEHELYLDSNNIPYIPTYVSEPYLIDSRVPSSTMCLAFKNGSWTTQNDSTIAQLFSLDTIKYQDVKGNLYSFGLNQDAMLSLMIKDKSGNSIESIFPDSGLYMRTFTKRMFALDQENGIAYIFVSPFVFKYENKRWTKLGMIADTTKEIYYPDIDDFTTLAFKHGSLYAAYQSLRPNKGYLDKNLVVKKRLGEDWVQIGGDISPGSIDSHPDIAFTQEGTIYVFYRNTWGFVKKFKEELPTDLGDMVSSGATNPEWSIYPNPNKSGTLYIKGIGNGIYYQIIDLLGKVCKEGEMSSNQIDVSFLAQGIYTFRLVNEAGSSQKMLLNE
jgi:hypothetical protein